MLATKIKLIQGVFAAASVTDPAAAFSASFGANPAVVVNVPLAAGRTAEQLATAIAAALPVANQASATGTDVSFKFLDTSVPTVANFTHTDTGLEYDNVQTMMLSGGIGFVVSKVLK